MSKAALDQIESTLGCGKEFEVRGRYRILPVDSYVESAKNSIGGSKDDNVGTCSKLASNRSLSDQDCKPW
jgi:hypothetical protein